MKKQTTAAFYREKLNQIEGQLTLENQAYFDDLRGYMSFGGLFLDEGELNAQLYQMASDLVVAQMDGVSAVAFFGNHPKLLADELLHNTKKASLATLLGMVSLVVGILWGINLINDFSQPGILRLSIPQYFLDAVIGVVGVGLIFLIMKHSFYPTKKSHTPQRWTSIAVVAVSLLVIGGQMASALLFIDDGLIRIPYPGDLLLLGAIMILAFAAVLLKGISDYYPIGGLVLGLVVIGGIHRLFVADVLTGRIWTVVQVVILVLTFVGVFIGIRRGNK